MVLPPPSPKTSAEPKRRRMSKPTPAPKSNSEPKGRRRPKPTPGPETSSKPRRRRRPKPTVTLFGPDPLSQHYADRLEGVYDCIDRLTINAYFPIAQAPGGFRTWWRDLFESDDNLDNNHLMRLAGRFSRRVRGWAKKHKIPVIDCRAGDRKHEIGEQYMPTDPTFTGIFCVLISRAPAPIWDVQRYGNNGINLRRKEPYPYVNHYFFHIWDADWGHLTIRMCGHPPFNAMVILNGHEYVANQASRQGIRFTKEGNCFTDWDHAAELNRVADTLRQPDAIGRLEQVLRHWLSRCLCLALDVAEQKKMHCQYAFSIYQVEYSRNLLFQRGRDLEVVFQGLIDRTRAALDLKTVTTIFGYKHRPNTREQTHREPRLRVVIERPTYDLTVFKIHCGSLTLKMYTKGARVLRTEVIVHNLRNQQRWHRSLPALPEVAGHLRDILDRFLAVVRCVDAATLDDGTLESLPLPSHVGRSRVSGIDVNRPRMVAVLKAVVALSSRPGGLTSGELAAKVRELAGQSEAEYGPRQASYDLKKLRGKALVERVLKSRRYAATESGLRTMAAVGIVREQVLKPILAKVCQPEPHLPLAPENRGPLENHYQAIQNEVSKLLQTLKIPA
jgi:DNA-binding transcriptional ArsR family regulator